MGATGAAQNLEHASSEEESEEDTESEGNTEESATDCKIAQGGWAHVASKLSEIIQSLHTEHDHKRELLQNLREIWEDDEADEVKREWLAAEALYHGIEQLVRMQRT